MRLIDAEWLKELYQPYESYNGKELAVPIGAILANIDDAPTIDAVSVVRCKECRFWQKSRERAVMCCLREVPNRPMNADDYCSYGEHKADRKTENCSGKPNNCDTCANGEGDIEACGYCRHGDLYKPKTEPTTEDCSTVETRLTAKCLNCANGGSYKCSKCDGEIYYKTEPQTCSVNGRPYDCGNCEYHKCTADEPQTDCTDNCHKCNRIRECGYPLVGKCEYEPQTERPCDNCQEFDCYGCEYKQTERSK